MGVLAGAFLLFKTLMERYVAAETERDLANTRRMVSLLIEERRARLGELAVALTGDSLTRTPLADRTLNQLTRDDIVNSEILPNYPQLNLLAAFFMDGSAEAITRSVLEKLRKFQGAAELEDDATLVVINLAYDAPRPAAAS